ncbi:hypothetical protein BDZ91DRAFT_759302 [Kalaharituber pfeilii]|nr:hypothetical protein BDZ91DRAFT_759302 [Kalaharituber pfeilii]
MASLVSLVVLLLWFGLPDPEYYYESNCNTLANRTDIEGSNPVPVTVVEDVGKKRKKKAALLFVVKQTLEDLREGRGFDGPGSGERAENVEQALKAAKDEEWLYHLDDFNKDWRVTTWWTTYGIRKRSLVLMLRYTLQHANLKLIIRASKALSGWREIFKARGLVPELRYLQD